MELNFSMNKIRKILDENGFTFEKISCSLFKH